MSYWHDFNLPEGYLGSHRDTEGVSISGNISRREPRAWEDILASIEAGLWPISRAVGFMLAPHPLFVTAKSKSMSYKDSRYRYLLGKIMSSNFPKQPEQQSFNYRLDS